MRQRVHLHCAGRAGCSLKMSLAFSHAGTHLAPSRRHGTDSRGGKAVQAYALNKELNGNLRSLIAIDMSPATGKVAPM